MKYMLTLFNEEETDWEDRTPEEAAASIAGWDAFTKDLVAAGAMVAGEGLTGSDTATTIRLADEHVTKDGPFAETKEQLVGFYLIDVPDLDAALEWAHKIPMPGGAVEVRAVIDYEAAGSTSHTNESAAS
jgi:hypothetical protein